MNKQNHYADPILDRVSHLRTNEAWLKTQIEADDTLVVPVWRTQSLITKPEEPPGEPVAVVTTAELEARLC